ncbi:MAG: hypothetical protein ACTTJJ_05460, partial [Prevotella fusca]|uniref:hypothetical protein n=1 Tax=Prevotella fusca TaxID=589436 RepID=UPI003FA0D693
CKGIEKIRYRQMFSRKSFKKKRFFFIRGQLNSLTPYIINRDTKAALSRRTGMAKCAGVGYKRCFKCRQYIPNPIKSLPISSISIVSMRILSQSTH